MTDRPEKWKGLERLTHQLYDRLHTFESMQQEIDHWFGPLLDAAEELAKADRLDFVELQHKVEGLLEKFK